MGQAGMVAGADGLLFGMLILLAGSLAFVNIWSIVDTRAALDAAGREYVRTYTEQRDPSTAAAAADRAARLVLDARGTPVRGLRIDAPPPAGFGPCAIASVRLEATVAAARLPFLDQLGERTVSVEARELIDPHKEVTTGERYDPDDTPCAPG
jgi:hypothetical protein